MNIHFVVIDGAGLIQRTGHCQAEDAAIQGDQVLTFEAAPDVSDATHYWDGETFQPLEAP